MLQEHEESSKNMLGVTKAKSFKRDFNTYCGIWADIRHRAADCCTSS